MAIWLGTGWSNRGGKTDRKLTVISRAIEKTKTICIGICQNGRSFVVLLKLQKDMLERYGGELGCSSKRVLERK